MTAPPVRTRVLDAGALLAEAQGDTYVMAVINVVLRSGSTLLVPASAIAVAIATRPAAEPRLLALTERPNVQVESLDASSARRVGRLLARGQLPIELLPAAHVVHIATQHDRCPVLAGDSPAIRQVDPDLTVEDV